MQLREGVCWLTGLSEAALAYDLSPHLPLTFLEQVCSAAGSLSMPPPSSLCHFPKDFGLSIILGHDLATATIFTVPHRLKSPLAVILKSTPFYLVWMTPETLHPHYPYKHTQ